jgi:hypothetical protein
MVAKAEATLYHRKDGKVLIYVPLAIAKDTSFPIMLPERGERKKVRIFFDDNNVVVCEAKS